MDGVAINRPIVLARKNDRQPRVAPAAQNPLWIDQGVTTGDVTAVHRESSIGPPQPPA